MKPYGIGLIIILISFVMGTYSAYVSYNYFANPPTALDVAARLDELKTASLVGLISSIIAIIGILIFLFEFMKHEHGTSPTRVSPPPP
ncbi:MAG: hypothetical protein ABSB28_10700 [Candidatus Bathyarchaeia archaeon]